jgi:hypothetical protein
MLNLNQQCYVTVDSVNSLWRSPLQSDSARRLLYKLRHHNCQYCVCGTVGIDGGTSPGNRLLGDLTRMETRSIYVAIVKGKRIWLPKDRIEAKFSQLALN